MPTFTATYTTASGRSRRLRLQSADLTTARRSLRQRGIVPTALEEVSETGADLSATAGEGLKGLLNADIGRLLESGPNVRERALFANKLAACEPGRIPGLLDAALAEGVRQADRGHGGSRRGRRRA